MLRSVPLKNKPLCMMEHHDDLYIGDARGIVYVLQSPYCSPRACAEAPAPVSALAQHEHGGLYYGTWDGTVHTGDKSKNLGTNMVKAMLFVGDRLFVSVDTKLFVLSRELGVLEEHETESKIHCMGACGSRVVFGMGRGLVSTYTDAYQPAKKSQHESTILSVQGDLSGDTYGKMLRNAEPIYESDGWVRAIHDAGLFSSGRNVIKDSKVLYSHDDEVVGLARIGGKIISIGLDYCYKIYEESFSLAEDEENELMELLNS